VREAIAWNRSVEAATFLPNNLGMEAELLALGGETGAALARMDEALALSEESGAAWERAVLLRQRGAILRAAGRAEAAEAALREAARVAEAQGAALFGLHAAVPLAQLLAETGRAAEGCGLLEAALLPFAAESEPVVLRARAALAVLRYALPA
jgi:ATP/maltotriose-dependent transcriptional regulator MalT